ncbi:LuxR C-terminal-related transcriptional regulator [Streptomyces lydicus]|uniref:helix-turn-helix transcriptional regulator n=1 Tax=Streptomyces lydicus TaxID=47763 RepID=UPI00370288F5
MALLGEIGRASEAARLRAVLEQVRTGRSPVVAVVHGEPGAGKSALLDAFAAGAASTGFHVAAVRGTRLEDRPFAAADRLIAQLWARRDDGDAPEVQHRGSPADDLPGMVEAVRKEARDAPVALCVDDMFLLDSWSMRWLLDLSRVLPPVPLAIALTARTCGTGSGRGIAFTGGTSGESGVALLVAAEHIDLAGLPVDALPEAAGNRCRVSLGSGAAAVCGELTGGNPALLEALLAPHAGSAPTAEELRATAASGVPAGADRWLASLSTPALALAQAVAVLGGGAEVAESAELARLTVEEALGAVDQLVAACLLANHTPLTFRHPLLAAMILGRIAAGTRVALHLRAAALLRDRQAATTAVARHLAAAGPVGKGWAVQQLRMAARQLEQEGRPQDAARHLRVALREPLRPYEKSAVRRELAELEAFVDPERAIRLLDTARRECHGPEIVVDYALAMATVLTECGRADDAVTVLDDTAARLGQAPAARPWQQRLRLHKALISRRGPLWLAQAADPLDALTLQTPRGGAVGRELAALRAAQAVDAGADRHAAVLHARQALSRSGGGGAAGSATLLWHACGALVAAGELTEAWTRCGRGRQVAGARPGRWDHVKVELLRATVLRARGDLAAADATLTPVVERLLVSSAAGHPSAVTAVAALAEVRALRGATGSASSLLTAGGLDRDPLPWRRDSARVLAARAVVYEPGDPARALEDLFAAGRLQEEAGVRNPAVIPWRSRAARILVARGERKDAADLARTELADARRWGTPESIGTALHALALTEAGERRIALLADAAGTLAPSSDRLQLALVRADLGESLAEAACGEAVGTELAAAFRLARACSAEPLARRVQAVRRRRRPTGQGSPPPSATSGATADPPGSVRHPANCAPPRLAGLTPQELKILQLARDGHSNRDIAGKLFVAVRTVEFHLSGAYRKLGITGRRQLAEVFSGA